MGNGDRQSQANTIWAIQNRYPFRTRGVLQGYDERDPLQRRSVYDRGPYSRRLDADRAAGRVTYSVWGRSGPGRSGPLCHYTRGQWVFNRSALNGKDAEMVRAALIPFYRRGISLRNEVI